jgi:hypothetical protein
VSRIGLDALADDGTLVGWATALRDGSPLSGVELSLAPFGPSERTDASGLARLALHPAREATLLRARHGADVAFLPRDGHDFGGWQGEQPVESVGWHVLDDRGVYRPGETARVKGWVRRLTRGPTGDVALPDAAPRDVRWTLTDPQGVQLLEGNAALSELGGFDLRIPIPKATNLGSCGLGLSLGAAQHHHALRVEELRRPDHAVTVEADPGPHVVGATVVATARATYHAGGGLPDAEVAWTVSSQPTTFHPQGRDDFTFGPETPWVMPRRGSWPGPVVPVRVETFSARTDASGQHRLAIAPESVTPLRTSSVTAEAAVQDVNRRAWAGRTTFLVHAARVHAGLRAPRWFADAGEPLEIDVILTDHDGNAVAGRELLVRAVRLSWEQVDGEWTEVEKDPVERRPTTGAEPVRCDLPVKTGGSWRVTATAQDDAGRATSSVLRMWVAGGPTPPDRGVEEQEVDLVADRREYAAGDVARLLVRSPFAPAEGLLALAREGLVETRRFSMASASTVLDVPISEAHVPNLHAEVWLAGATAQRPAHAHGAVVLQVPPRQRTLRVTIEPQRRELQPGGATTLDLDVRDATGAPVADAEVAVVVADEAVLSLTGYDVADPLATFYAPRDAGLAMDRSRRHVVLATLRDPRPHHGGVPSNMIFKLERAAAPMAMAASMAGDALAAAGMPAPIAVRSDLNPLALFEPAVRTGADGRARIPFQLPQSLTRYRVFAVAVAGDKNFGKGESSLVARLPLTVRASAPRFLNHGDEAEVGVVVQNLTDSQLQVLCAARASNLAWRGPAGAVFEVPAMDRRELRFKLAARSPGTARLQVGVASGGLADAVEVALPVYTPATTEAFATYGTIDEGAVAQPVEAPRGVLEGFGGLEVTTSSTALTELTDAVLYLTSYPFECAEQVASRVLAIASLQDLLAAFNPKQLPSPEALQARVEADLERLSSLQRPDGGFGFWSARGDDWPYLAVHVAHALARARTSGYAVPARAASRVTEYLAHLDRRLDRSKGYDGDVRLALLAAALRMRQLLGDAAPGEARALVREAGGSDRLPIEAVAYLLPLLSTDAKAAALVPELRRVIDSAVTETASTAHVATSYGQGDWLVLHSSRRTDAIVLEALLETDPGSDLVPKLVRGLLEHRVRGRWGSTQECAWALVALQRYFRAHEAQAPDFFARAWLGDSFLLQHAFTGRSGVEARLDVPMRVLGERAGVQELLLSKVGRGRMYYRLGLRYAPADLRLEAASHGFEVSRAYEAVDDPADVSQDADGTWRLRAGARVRVNLELVAPAERTHVALVDPLPAGLEPEHSGLEVTQAERPDEEEPARGLGWRAWPWRSPWHDHENVRDDRAEAFATRLGAGVHAYSHICRATTPGRYVVPPARAEEMYHPETFGRTPTALCVVE